MRACVFRRDIQCLILKLKTICFSDRAICMVRPEYMKQIEECITAAPVGSAFITSDFLDITDIPAINKVLSRLTESGNIRRIIRGCNLILLH